MHKARGQSDARCSVRTRPPPLTQCGYTLLELVLVVAILGVVAVAAMPDLKSTRPYGVDLAAEEVAEAMRFARSESMRLGRPYGIDVRQTTPRIRVLRMDTTTTPWTAVNDVRHPVSKRAYSIVLIGHPFTALSSLTRTSSFRGTCDATRERVYFDANGTPWCAAPETVLLEEQKVTLKHKTWKRVVTLHGITGRVTIE